MSAATDQNAVEQREECPKQKTSLHLPARRKEKAGDLGIGTRVLSLSMECRLSRSVTISDSDINAQTDHSYSRGRTLLGVKALVLSDPLCNGSCENHDSKIHSCVQCNRDAAKH